MANMIGSHNLPRPAGRSSNRTGNYTVLRELASPSFQRRNTAADLSQIFAGLRRTNLDLSMAAVAAPRLAAPPLLDAKRRLRYKGSLPLAGGTLVFEIAYEPIGRKWLLYGLGVGLKPHHMAKAKTAQAIKARQ